MGLEEGFQAAVEGFGQIARDAFSFNDAPRNTPPVLPNSPGIGGFLKDSFEGTPATLQALKQPQATGNPVQDVNNMSIYGTMGATSYKDEIGAGLNAIGAVSKIFTHPATTGGRSVSPPAKAHYQTIASQHPSPSQEISWYGAKDERREAIESLQSSVADDTQTHRGGQQY